MDLDEYEPILNTLNLSIELDTDINYDDGSENEENRIPWHRPRNIRFEIPLPLETRISDLSRDAREILVSHLSLPTLGTTMKNWESIAHSLGMSVDTIMALRQGTRPCEEMLDRNQKEPMFRLIVAIENAQRLDTLYSLSNLAKHQKLLKQFSARNEMHNDMLLETSCTYDDSAAYSGTIDSKSFILITHIESTKAEEKRYSFLKKNLKKFITEFEVLDMHDGCVIRDSNIPQSTTQVFRRAKHIVVVLNQSYVDLYRSNNSASNEVQAIRIINSLMDHEYFSNRCNNYRFRHVVFPELGEVQLPDGWAKSSNPYQFPAMSSELFAKLNKEPLKP